ncbi:L-histidine N(alpha)-methyltransferase [Candidatus Methylospira mobilis]|uniref:L-histidine N(Alpha)-methyltransferase n=1 Tax=Candidatus Methylospira mobilis TaxID=1808979 RepID=A0A5Q0BNM7_9GAMM|nr:L-histidine N(alpha)-methyltransferase [Candidatus Methylospira mobilis]QFY43356.1 L-histidine N(alpha)-methyltransferase [Candidatus Methylospira mobilis]WNV03426.1 L-histidine N(alpha)-methyltransferase [Candidatus Methylospira mobilis]
MNTESFRPVWVHPSLRGEMQARKRADSLCLGEMEHAFHYVGVRQTQLWLEVHRNHAPMFGDPAFEAIYRRIFTDVAANLNGQPLHVIGLGTGGGQKESRLLEALQSAGCPCRYTPIDISLELALLSAETAAGKSSYDIMPVAGDLSLLSELPDWLERYPAGEMRIYTAFGLTPNFLPSWLFPRLHGVLRPQDKLLLSANLALENGASDTDASYHSACAAILPQYDNAETRQWLGQVLVDWGIAEYLTPLRFTIKPIEKLQAFVARSTWREDVSFPWEGKYFQARKGDELRLFFSLRYTPKRLEEVLNRHGFTLGPGYCTPCGREGVWQMACYQIESSHPVESEYTSGQLSWK